MPFKLEIVIIIIIVAISFGYFIFNIIWQVIIKRRCSCSNCSNYSSCNNFMPNNCDNYPSSNKNANLINIPKKDNDGVDLID